MEPLILPKMMMFVLMAITVSLNIFPNEGQPMGTHCMDIYPLVLQGMMPHSTQGCQNLELYPLVVNPQLSVPCEVEHLNIPEPHKFEPWKRGKWKMGNLERIPKKPWVGRLKPQKKTCSRQTNQESGKGTTQFNDTPSASVPVEAYKHVQQNVGTNLVHNDTVQSNKDVGIASQTPEIADKNTTNRKGITSTLIHDDSGWISNVSQGPMIFYERHPNVTVTAGPEKTDDGNSSLTNPGNTNITNSPAIAIHCKPPSLVALNCLACLLAKCGQNNTVNGTICIKKTDDRDYITSGAHISKNSNSSQIHTVLTKEQIAALEDCLAKGNKSEPYLVNGRRLIVKLRFLNQTEKQFVLSKKMGQDFLVAIPQEDNHEKEVQTNITGGSNADLPSTTEPENRVDNHAEEPTEITRFEEMILASERNELKGKVTRESKVIPTTSSDQPHAKNQVTKSLNENSTTPCYQQDEGWLANPEEDCEYLENGRDGYPFLIRPPFGQNSFCDRDSSPTDFSQPQTYSPLENQYYSKPNVALMATPCHFTQVPSFTHGYPGQMEPLAPHLWKASDCLSQPAPLIFEKPIEGAFEGMNDQNGDRRITFHTLRHRKRHNYPVDCHVSPNAVNVGAELKGNDPSHKHYVRHERKDGVRYEKCRGIECMEPAKGIRFGPEGRSFLSEQSEEGSDRQWESDYSAGPPSSSPELNGSQCSDLDPVSWPANNFYPQQPQITPENYIATPDSQNWRPLSPIIQPNLVPCPGRICSY